MTTENMWQELRDILSNMEIPLDRFDDIFWLNRNIGIRNSQHPDIQEARNLIRNILKAQWVSGYTLPETLTIW